MWRVRLLSHRTAFHREVDSGAESCLTISIFHFLSNKPNQEDISKANKGFNRVIFLKLHYNAVTKTTRAIFHKILGGGEKVEGT